MVGLVGLVLVLLGAGPTKRGRKGETSTPAPAAAEVPAIPVLTKPLFDGSLPLDAGPPVQGLANRSAQGCRGCHPAAHDGWAAGPHGQPMSRAMADALEQAAIPACGSCHLPLVEQHDELPSWERTDAPGPFNPGWDATLRTEGVTCAACHVRNGRVAVATKAAARKVAPHPVVYAEDLSDERACAACHQLTWPGADAPLYDTVGEWSRSAWKAAGVGCVDCHWPGPDPHADGVDPARAWSLIVRPERRRIVRGSEPWTVAITLQNTGAGHAMPSGTPFRGYRLRARVTEPDGVDSLGELGELSADLVRTLTDEAPWTTVEDTRLPAGGERAYTYVVEWTTQVQGGRYDLLVELLETRRGTVVGDPVVRQRVRLEVQ